LQTQHLDPQFVVPSSFLMSMPLLLVALPYQRAQYGFQRFAVIGQWNRIGFVVHLKIGRKQTYARHSRTHFLWVDFVDSG
jgi:hypothetical protein